MSAVRTMGYWTRPAFFWCFILDDGYREIGKLSKLNSLHLIRMGYYYSTIKSLFSSEFSNIIENIEIYACEPFYDSDLLKVVENCPLLKLPNFKKQDKKFQLLDSGHR